jgi:hypothetical protein
VTDDRTTSDIHWSFWAIVVVMLLYNIAGVINFIAQMNADAVATMPEAYRALIEGRPAWATGAFAVAVFGGVLGCLLLLVKKSAARNVFIASLFGAAMTMVHILGVGSLEFVIGNAIQVLVTAFLIWYSMRVRAKGWIS